MTTEQNIDIEDSKERILTAASRWAEQRDLGPSHAKKAWRDLELRIHAELHYTRSVAMDDRESGKDHQEEAEPSSQFKFSVAEICHVFRVPPFVMDPWISWNGGRQSPVHPDSYILIRLRDGREMTVGRPQWLAWTHSKDGADADDIVAYRPIQDQS